MLQITCEHYGLQNSLGSTRVWRQMQIQNISGEKKLTLLSAIADFVVHDSHRLCQSRKFGELAKFRRKSEMTVK